MQYLAPKRLGEEIKVARVRAKLSQADLGEKLQISAQAVSQWETGQLLPSLRNYFQLRQILNLPEMLVEAKEEKPCKN